MHSSKLRSTDFHLQWRGEPVAHSEFFAGFANTDRLGLFTPDRFEGAGAVTLVMAYVTAFYDRYRESGPDFRAYPDFYTFQRTEPVAHYGMFDIWPAHKDVLVSSEAEETAAAITDRGVNVLLVPDGPTRECDFDAVQIESARRNINRCFVYSSDGRVEPNDLVLECDIDPLSEYALAVFDSVDSDGDSQEKRKFWLSQVESSGLRQSFREVGLMEALQRL